MLIDSHCHLPHSKYTKPLDALLGDAAKSGVAGCITIGTSVDENKVAVSTANKYLNVYCTVGIYPHENMFSDLDMLQESLSQHILNEKKVVAIGECGIDLSETFSDIRPLDSQKRLFEMQIELALKHNLPIVLHNNNGDLYVKEMFSKYKGRGLRGVAHCYSSDIEFAKFLLDFGFDLSFTGRITYKSRRDLLDVVAYVPNDRILVETDSPYLPPEGYRGQPNEPKNVVEIARKISEVKDVPFEKLCDLTYSNTCRLFFNGRDPFSLGQ